MSLLFILLVATGCIVLWIVIYMIYVRGTLKLYSRYIKLRNINADSTIREKLLRIYFLRYQSYEISAYIILGLSILILVACIYVFLFANEIINPPSSIAKPSEQFVIVSILSVRTGIALIIFFITKVLLRLYNFCLRISIFYMSRFDVLLSYVEMNMDMDKAIQFMTPTDLMNLNPPKTEIDNHFVEILKEFNGHVKR